MTTIENNTFKLYRSMDSLILVNKLVTNIEYSLKKVTNEEIEDVDNIILEGEAFIKLTTNFDSFYILTVDGINVYLQTFYKLREKLIPLIKDIVCNKCDCLKEDCIGKEAKFCLKSQAIFNTIHTYFNLIKPFSINTEIKTNLILYNKLERFIQKYRDYTLEELGKQFLNSCINGKPKINIELFSFYISAYYLSLYYYDKNSIDSTNFTEEELAAELEYLDTIYDYKSISNCISKLGINLLDELLLDTSNLKVYYWQLDNVLDTLPNVTSLLSETYLLTKNVENYNVFKEGKIVSYNDIGRIVFIIKDTSPTNFLLEDSLGNNVTDDFDTEYIVGLSASVYVSKDIRTYSNIFFKFKTLI